MTAWKIWPKGYGIIIWIKRTTSPTIPMMLFKTNIAGHKKKESESFARSQDIRKGMTIILSLVLSPTCFLSYKAFSIHSRHKLSRLIPLITCWLLRLRGPGARDVCFHHTSRWDSTRGRQGMNETISFWCDKVLPKSDCLRVPRGIFNYPEMSSFPQFSCLF